MKLLSNCIRGLYCILDVVMKDAKYLRIHRYYPNYAEETVVMFMFETFFLVNRNIFMLFSFAD